MKCAIPLRTSVRFLYVSVLQHAQWLGHPRLKGTDEGAGEGAGSALCSASRSRCAHSPVQVSRNVRAPLLYSFVRPQVAGDEAAFDFVSAVVLETSGCAAFDFVSAVEIVDFVVLETSGGLVAEPSRACFASCFASYFAFASDAAASARYTALLT